MLLSGMTLCNVKVPKIVCLHGKTPTGSGVPYHRKILPHKKRPSCPIFESIGCRKDLFFLGLENGQEFAGHLSKTDPHPIFFAVSLKGDGIVVLNELSFGTVI